MFVYYISYFFLIFVILVRLYSLSFPTCGWVADLKTRLLSDRKDKSGVEIWSRSRGWVVDQKTKMKARSISEVCHGSDDKDKVAR